MLRLCYFDVKNDDNVTKKSNACVNRALVCVSKLLLCRVKIKRYNGKLGLTLTSVTVLKCVCVCVNHWLRSIYRDQGLAILNSLFIILVNLGHCFMCKASIPFPKNAQDSKYLPRH